MLPCPAAAAAAVLATEGRSGRFVCEKVVCRPVVLSSSSCGFFANCQKTPALVVDANCGPIPVVTSLNQ